jgi:hypothetical protein
MEGGLEPIRPIAGSIPTHQARIAQSSIPKDLVGILCRKFDGDGLIVTKLSVDGMTQTAMYSAKYVPTKKLIEQQKWQKQHPSNNRDSNTLPPMGRKGRCLDKTRQWKVEPIVPIPMCCLFQRLMMIMKKKLQSICHSIRSEILCPFYAFAEGGTPVELDILTHWMLLLLCLRSSTTGGSSTVVAMVADRITNLTNDQGKIETFQGFFSAHYVQDPITKDIYNHGLKL